MHLPAMMFQEGDWNDSQDAQALTNSLRVSSSSRSASQQAGVSPGAGRKKTTKHLLETLRVLEGTSKTRQDFHEAQPVKHSSESEDSTAETAPVKTRRKKKRSKRRKQGLNSDRSGSEPQRLAEKRNGNGPDSSEVTLKRKPAGEPDKTFKKKKTCDGAKQCSEIVEGNDLTAAEFSRKQWKNKQKNKRRNKNKFKARATTVEAAQMPEEEQADIPAAQPGKKQVPTVAPNKETMESVNSNSSRLKENCHSSQGSQLQKSSNTAVSKTSAMKEQASASGGEAGIAKLKPQKLAKLKKILQEQSKQVHEVGTEGVGGSQSVVGEENTKEAELEASLPPSIDRSATLRMKMEERLKSARFRYINQQLYTSSSNDAQVLFQKDPEAFDIYHHGYRSQVERWPENPVDVIIKYLRNRPASLVVADFGCGDCKIARSVRNTVHSFDLVALNEHVTVCDMAKVPLPDGSVDIAVFCLALMGTNLRDFFAEANRILKQGGVLKLAEVASRFEDVRLFLSALANMGFKNTSKDTENSFFYTFEFTKTGPPKSKGKLPGLELKPCLYKKR
ncbi:ribosomal RNA-processing protein 8 [Ambystoma mexicanum]|uniref:ribosomal RNA-processing protein 8 n=1 Tax=Ambystoma mexicanum TaxID=8296 RepID=UPI0037E88515